MHTIRRTGFRMLLLAGIIMLAVAGSSYALTVDLVADATTITTPNGKVIPFWGFGLPGELVSVPGPLIEATEGDDLIINLTNNLKGPISIIINGQTLASPTPVMAGGRVLSFTPHVPGNGGVGSVTFTGLRAGTYLYECGSNPAMKIPMGLYGVLIVRPATAGQAYEDPVSAFTSEHVVILSDIDPTLNDAVTGGKYGTVDYPSTVNYDAKYFLINGKPFPETVPMYVANGDRVLLRFVNAGTDNYSPMVGGAYVEVIAEDGNLLPFPDRTVSVLLPAGKTKDVIFTPADDTRYPVFDRRLNLTNAGADDVGGFLAYLLSGTATPPPPIIDSFTATPSIIAPGGASTLEWQTTYATSVSIDWGLGPQDLDGSAIVTPGSTRTFTLSATGIGGTVTAQVTVFVQVTAPFLSIAAQDGWVLESTETSNVGGTGNVTDAGAGALRVGDHMGTAAEGERQYKSLLSFDTSSIPDGATVVSATLRLIRGGLVGTSPFTAHGTCYVDIATGGFGGNVAPEITDFEAVGTAAQVATMSNPAANGDASTGSLNAAGLAAINKVGVTQLKVYFSLDDNDNDAIDAMGFFSGNSASAANRPVLEVTYQL